MSHPPPTTTQISRVMKQAEDDSAALFKLAGQAAASGSASGAAPGAGAYGAVNDGSGSGAGGSGGTGGSASGSARTGPGGGAVAGPGGAGKNLKVTGDVQGFADLANDILGGVQYEVVVSADGVVSLRANGVQGPLTREAQALVDVLQRSMNGGTPTTLEFVNTDPDVIGGQYSTGKVDLDDIRQFGEGPGLSTAGALVHEIQEQFRKQVFGESYPVAHTSALDAEAQAVGARRGARDTVRTINRTTRTATMRYTYPGGKVVNVVVTVTNGNFTRVNRQ
jgi:hypothetical protein